MKKNILLFSLFSVLVVCGNLFADTIFLKNGTKFTGRTIRQDAEKVLFRIGLDKDGVDITFFSEQILRIDRAEVSSFISLPFGQGKQIEIPRPIFGKEPLLTEQVRSQTEKRQKADEDEKTKTKTAKQEEKQLEGPPKVSGSDLSAKEKMIMEELTPLLSDEEKDYFSKVNSMVKQPMEGATLLLSNPNAFVQDSNKFQEVINTMSSQIGGIIKQLNSIKPPDLFVIFHKKSLDTLTLIEDMFMDISKGEVASSQIKTEKLQNMNNELQEELIAILNEKKNKSP